MASVAAAIVPRRFGLRSRSLKLDLNIFAAVPSIHMRARTQIVPSQTAPLRLDCLKKRALRRLPPPSIVRFFFS
jgi:hypothetical protein